MHRITMIYTTNHIISMNARLRPLLIAAALSFASAHAQRISLPDWQFSRDSVSWNAVTIPHSYNGTDGRSPRYFRGKAFYRTEIQLNKADLKTPLTLYFEGAAQAATIYVNGHKATLHKGGYTPFAVDVVPFVHVGTNEVVVVCDNSVDLELAPIDSDFNKNGGLHNPVSLYKGPHSTAALSSLGKDRMHVSTTSISAESATLQLNYDLGAFGSDNERAHSRKTGSISYRIVDAAGEVVFKGTEKAHLADFSGQSTLSLPHPHLWQGTRDPYLYTAEVKICDGKKIIDRMKTRFGIRTFEMTKDHGFFLNGEPYALRGTSIHQDLEGKATALSLEDYERDYTIVKELGCNFVRLAHYPHNERAFELCDSLGLVVQTEIPWVNICGQRATEAYYANLESQLTEMISSLYNHPSIAFWGLWNELAGWGNKEQFQGAVDYDKVASWTARLYDKAKSLDPHRYVGVTDCELLGPAQYPSLKADYISENRYYGWYYGRFDEFRPGIEGVHNKDKVTNVSEYGAGNNPYCHTWNAAEVNNKDNARHYEEWANLYHESHLAQIEEMPWLNFTSIWILFDFAVAARQEGYLDSDDGVNFVENDARKYTNDKGLVTRDRSLKKDVFYLYKAKWNSDVETVYAAKRRLRKAPADTPYEVKVYSNAPSLTLYHNGQQLQTLTTSGEITGVIWRFDSIPLVLGTNTFRVVSSNGTEDTICIEGL